MYETAYGEQPNFCNEIIMYTVGKRGRGKSEDTRVKKAG